jgi:hypothetical protein
MLDYTGITRFWSDAALAYAQASTASMALSANMAQEFWGTALKVSTPPVATSPLRAKSWYRAPASNPFDPATWVPGWRSGDPWGLRGSTLRAWTNSVAAQSWPGFKAPSPVLDMWTVALPAFWSQAPSIMTPVAAMSNYPAAVFSAYRSDSGHAVAQIICETMVAAAKMPIPSPLTFGSRSWH